MARDAGESSVLFSLREIMDLERARIAGEEAEARAVAAEAERRRVEEERRDREQVERAVRSADQREQEAQLAEARRQAAHEEALLRIRLEVEAKSRAESERLALEHQRALRRLHLESRSTWIARALAATLALGASGVGAAYVLAVEPALRAAHERMRVAQHQADAQTAENAELVRRLLEAKAEATSPGVAPAVTESVNAPAPQKSSVEQVPGESHRRRRAPPRSEPEPSDRTLEGLEDDPDDDPLKGLFDKRQTPR